MRVVRKRPGEEPEIVDVENTLESLQKEVGGKIESLRFAADATILCNEEGKLLGLQPNVWFLGDVLCGTILVVGFRGDAFCNMTMAGARMMCEYLKSKWLWGS